MSILEIVSPQWTNFVLATNIPNSKTYVFILNRFDIEPYQQVNDINTFSKNTLPKIMKYSKFLKVKLKKVIATSSANIIEKCPKVT